jgi:hypothetical protein
LKEKNPSILEPSSKKTEFDIYTPAGRRARATAYGIYGKIAIAALCRARKLAKSDFRNKTWTRRRAHRVRNNNQMWTKRKVVASVDN